MTQEEIIAYCLQKPGAYLDYPFGPETTIVKVQNKIFAQVFMLRGDPMATFNCEAIDGQYYRCTYPDIITRGYHCPPIQQPYFNTVKLNGGLDDNVIREMIDASYKRVLKKMTRAQREALQGID